MQISINTSEADKDELTALIALCASLGGRLPSRGIGAVHVDLSAGALSQEEAEDALAGQMGESEDERTAAHADVNMGRRGPPLGTEVPPPPAATGDVDSKGIPWDARIHSESKATIADGSWRKRRGVDDATYATVLAELQGAAPPPPPAESTVPLAPADDTPPPPPAHAEAPSENVAAAPAAGPNLSAFADFPAFVSAVSKHGKSYAELNELAGSVGVAAFKDMKDHGDKWDLFFSMLG